MNRKNSQNWLCRKFLFAHACSQLAPKAAGELSTKPKNESTKTLMNIQQLSDTNVEYQRKKNVDTKPARLPTEE